VALGAAGGSHCLRGASARRLGVAELFGLATPAFIAMVMLWACPGAPFGAKLVMTAKADLQTGAALQVLLASIGSITFGVRATGRKRREAFPPDPERTAPARVPLLLFAEQVACLPDFWSCSRGRHGRRVPGLQLGRESNRVHRE